MPKDLPADPLAILERDQAARLARKLELEALRAELTFAQASGDPKAGKSLTDARVESERLQTELSDLAAAIDVAKARAEAARLSAAKSRAQDAARDALRSLDVADVAADELGVAARAFAHAAKSFPSARAAAKDAVGTMTSHAAEAQVPIDAHGLNRLTQPHLPTIAAVELIRNAFFRELFDSDAFQGLGEAGRQQVDWSVPADPAQIAEHGKDLNAATRAAVAAYL